MSECGLIRDENVATSALDGSFSFAEEALLMLCRTVSFHTYALLGFFVSVRYLFFVKVFSRFPLEITRLNKVVCLLNTRIDLTRKMAVQLRLSQNRPTVNGPSEWSASASLAWNALAASPHISVRPEQVGEHPNKQPLLYCSPPSPTFPAEITRVPFFVSGHNSIAEKSRLLLAGKDNREGKVQPLRRSFQ